MCASGCNMNLATSLLGQKFPVIDVVESDADTRTAQGHVSSRGLPP
jgi:hypothetical protein